MNATLKLQYLAALLLIISSIVLAYIQVLSIDTIADGTLIYIAQAFLLVGSIFGLDAYTKKIVLHVTEKLNTNAEGFTKQ